MPYDVPFSKTLRRTGRQVKVYDCEGPETPHVTIRYKAEEIWRVSLRDGAFIVPPGGGWKAIPVEIKVAVENHWKELQLYWDKQNPHNPINSKDDE